MSHTPQTFSAPIDIPAETTNFEGLAFPKLKKQWARVFKSMPPQGLSRDLMVRGLTYKLQEKAFGGLSQANRRKLQTLARQLEAQDKRGFDMGPILKPGAKLIREWQARTYVVTVLEDGFELEGRRYGSLSMIAREITGTRWSGPRFFGLKKGKGDADGR